IRARISRLRAPDSVLLLGDRDDVPRLFAAADANVLSSHSEAMSLSLLEALAAGAPSVATRVGGNPEIVLDGRTGFLVECTPAAFASALDVLARSSEIRAHMSAE